MADQLRVERPDLRGEADERYRRLIEQSGVGLFQTRADGKIEWVNSAAARVFGYETPEQFMRSVTDIRDVYVNPERRTELLQLLEHNDGVSGFEYEMRRPDGGRRWVSLTANAIRDLDGRLEGFEGTFVDVTERKALEAATGAMSSDLEPTEAVARFADVLARTLPFRQLSLAVIEGDRFRRVVSISGDDEHEPLPMAEWQPLAGHPLERVARDGNVLVVQDTAAGEWPFDEQLVTAEIGSYAIFPLIHEPDRIATFNLGMEARHAFTPEVLSLLAAHTAAVANAVRNIVLYENQRELVQRLEEVARLRNEFLASASHDLRNPVSVMCGVAEVLESQWDRIDDHKKRQMLGSLARSARTVHQLLQRDLDVSLIEQGELRYDIAPFDLRGLVCDIVDTFEQSGSDRVLTVEMPDPLPRALGDEKRQSQILHNLLSNAVKFSPRGSTIRVEVVRTQDHIRVSVADEGEGIDDKGKLKLFQRLSRLGSSAPGTGLGLYMAKAMVEAQGGEIWADSRPGTGSRFSYTVPLADAATR